MARVIIVPIKNRGDCVLIVTRYSGADLVGFVSCRTLALYCEQVQTCHESVEFVERHLPRLEPALHRKSLAYPEPAGTIACVEMTVKDLETALSAGG